MMKQVEIDSETWVEMFRGDRTLLTQFYYL